MDESEGDMKTLLDKWIMEDLEKLKSTRISEKTREVLKSNITDYIKMKVRRDMFKKGLTLDETIKIFKECGL